jgi:DNA replication licensing factor MCM5
MHGSNVYYSDQNLNAEFNAIEGTNTHFQAAFKTFLHNFTRENTRAYHRMLATQIQKNKYALPLELSDLKAYDEQLYEKFIAAPLDILKVMEEGVKSYVREKREEFPNASDEEWQVTIRSDEIPKKMREVSSSLVSKIFVMSGIIISSTKPYIKASKLKLRCRNCMATRVVELAPGQFPYIPTFCQGQPNTASQKCPNDPFVAMPDSEVIDTQSLKIQESP